MALFGGIELPDRPDPANIQRLDLLPVPMLRKMMRFGLRIDKPHFEELSSRLGNRMTQLRKDITSEIPVESLERFVGADADSEPEVDDEAVEDANSFNVESPEQVADLLYGVLHLDLTPNVKIKKTKSGGRLTTGKKTLEQLKREHPIVALLLEYRECSKLKGTYADSMPRKAVLHRKGPDCIICGRKHFSDEWRVHTQILTTRTPARFASKSPNLQNIPIKGDLGKEIRAGFIASEGYRIVQRDWSQIELRLLADCSGDPALVRVYLDDGDVHEETAFGLFDASDNSTDPVARRICAKTCNFSIVFGTTEVGLYEQLCDSFSRLKIAFPEWLSESGCAALIARWYAKYKGAQKYLQSEESKIRRFAIVWTKVGRVRRIPEVRSCHSYIQSAGIRQGCNHSIQGFAADLMRLAMGELTERFEEAWSYGFEAHPLLSIHDELLVEAPEDHAETMQAIMGDVMDNVLVDKQTGILLSKVPIKSDGKLLIRWEK